jgi:hypothetical protein
MQCLLQMSHAQHCSKARQHGDLGAEVDPPELTHPSQDTNQLHERHSHGGLKQWGNILFGGKSHGNMLSPCFDKEKLPLLLDLRPYNAWTTMAFLPQLSPNFCPRVVQIFL